MPLLVASLTGWLFILSQSAPPASPAVTPVGDGVAAVQTASTQRPQQEPTQSPQKVVSVDRLAYRSHLDVPLTVFAVGAWIVAEIDKTSLVPVDCKWCDWAPDGSNTLNGIDSWGRRAMLWHKTGRALTASNITGLMLAPASAYGLDWFVAAHDGRKWDAPVDAILITQAMAVASDVAEMMKFAIGRERPFVHVLAPLARANSPDSADNNTSFPSGHTTLAFALVTSSAEIAKLRGYTRAAWFLRAGLPIAMLTAYFRVAADRHYVTDVLAGAGVGSAVGFGLPYLAHRRKADHRIPTVRIVPTKRGEMLQARWAW